MDNLNKPERLPVLIKSKGMQYPKERSKVTKARKSVKNLASKKNLPKMDESASDRMKRRSGYKDPSKNPLNSGRLRY